MVNNWLNIGLSGLFPPTCQLCNRDGVDGLDLCLECVAKLPQNCHPCRRCALPLTEAGGAQLCGECLCEPPIFFRATSPYIYSSPLDGLIQQLKYRHSLKAGSLLGQLLARHLAQRLVMDLPEVIMPVPLHANRLRQRGFNQSLELALPLGESFGIPIDNCSCHRNRATRAQSDLKAKQRRANVRRAFRVEPVRAYSHVALIDDVITTGATVRELARTLHRAGVAKIEVWSVARAPKP